MDYVEVIIQEEGTWH